MQSPSSKENVVSIDHILYNKVQNNRTEAVFINTILLIEDDPALCQGIILAMQNETTQFISCHTLREAENVLKKHTFSLLILDINLPDGNGLDFLKNLRKSSDLPVILLTANDLETDVVSGLELGADDYITKPFSLAILRARVNTQLRRQKTGTAGLILDSFLFQFEQMEFFSNGQPVELSRTEQKLLRLLVEHRGQVLTRRLLMERIWPDGPEVVEENALSVTVKRLRDKLEPDPAKPRYIKTVYGTGYIWVVNGYE